MISNTQINNHKMKKAQTAFFFLLAMLMLVISCPVKRLANAGKQIPSASRQALKISESNRQHAASYAAKSCCLEKFERTEAKETHTVLPSLELTDMQSFQSGFAIYHYLSTIKVQYPTTEQLLNTSLPLYLQHRRLLI